VAVRLPAGSSGPVILSGRLLGRAWSTVIDPASVPRAEGISALWAGRRIADLERQAGSAGPDGATRRAIRELALAYGVLAPDTALVFPDGIAAIDGPPAAVIPAAEPLPRRGPGTLLFALGCLLAAAGLVMVARRAVRFAP
jgi:hypothetical protein